MSFHTGRAHTMDVDGLPAQGPIAPPQQRGPFFLLPLYAILEMCISSVLIFLKKIPTYSQVHRWIICVLVGVTKCVSIVTLCFG